MNIFTHNESFSGHSPHRLYDEHLLKGIRIAAFAAQPSAGGFTLINAVSDCFVLVFVDGDCGLQLYFDGRPLSHSATGLRSVLYCGKNIHQLSVHSMKEQARLVTVFIPCAWLSNFMGERCRDMLFAPIEMAANVPVCAVPCKEQSILLKQLTGYQSGEGADKAMLQVQLLGLLEAYFCSRYPGDYRGMPYAGTFNKQDMELIRVAEEYILREFCSDDFTVQLLVKQIAANYNRLNCLFKNKHGMKVSEYIRLKRIEKSKEMIAGGDKSISEIAYEIGYSSISNYILAFKKIYQVTPGNYKRQVI